MAARLKDMTGKTFTKLTVIRRAESSTSGEAKWFCACECGGTRIVSGNQLRRGEARDCGCGRGRKRASRMSNWPRRTRLVNKKMGSNYLTHKEMLSALGKQGMTSAEIGKLCECKTQTVASAMHRAGINHPAQPPASIKSKKLVIPAGFNVAGYKAGGYKRHCDFCPCETRTDKRCETCLLRSRAAGDGEKSMSRLGADFMSEVQAAYGGWA